MTNTERKHYPDTKQAVWQALVRGGDDQGIKNIKSVFGKIYFIGGKVWKNSAKKF